MLSVDHNEKHQDRFQGLARAFCICNRVGDGCGESCELLISALALTGSVKLPRCLSSASKSVLLDFTSTSVICSVGRLARRGHSATHYHFTSIAVPDRLAAPVLRPSVRPCQQFSIQLLQMSNLGSNRGSSYRWQTKRST